jgi:hypothetical protein
MKKKLLHKTSLRQVACAVIAVLTIGAWLPQADAKTFQVKNLNNSGNGSLRDALTKLATSNDPSNTINFKSGLDGVIYLSSTLPQISKSVSVNGPGAGEITIVGYNGGIFNVFSGIVSISGLTLQGKGCDGSGILRNQFAVLTVDECVITSKGSTDQVGIFNESGATTVVNASSIVKNRSSGDGGGIVNQGSLNLINSTIASNKAVKGGAIFNDAFSTLSLVNCTIADNTASNSGGGIFNSEGGTATLANTIVGRNFKTLVLPNDVAGEFTRALVKISSVPQPVAPDLASRTSGTSSRTSSGSPLPSRRTMGRRQRWPCCPGARQSMQEATHWQWMRMENP